MNVAVIDIVRLLDESKRGKGMSGQLRSVADKWQEQLTETESKILKTRERLEKSGAGAPEDTLFKLERDLRIFDLELRNLRERQRLDIEAHRDHYRRQLLAEVKPILEAVAKEKGLGLVLTVAGSDVPYVAPESDITADVLARFDAG